MLQSSLAIFEECRNSQKISSPLGKGEQGGFHSAFLPFPYARNPPTSARPARVQLTPAITSHLAYYYAPESRITGPFVTPGGPVPGTRVSNTVSSNAILLSFDEATGNWTLRVSDHARADTGVLNSWSLRIN